MHQPMAEEESGFDTLGGKVKLERTLVHRRMPDWISHPHIVETDIKSHSRPITEFSLPDVILKNLHSMGVTQLFPVQSHVVPHLTKATTAARMTGVAPSDLLVCAPTGCGKTLCYVVPVSCALLDYHVHKVMDKLLTYKVYACFTPSLSPYPCFFFSPGQLRAIVVLPTAEVAAQVHLVFKQVLHGTGMAAVLVCGELPCDRESEAMVDADVVVTTPGRLVEHLHTSSIPPLSHLRFLVVDEADRLLDRAHQSWLGTLLSAVYGDAGGSPCTTKASSPGVVLNLPNALSSTWSLPRRTPAVTLDVGHVMYPSLPLQKLLFSATLSYSPEHLATLALHRPVLYSTSEGTDEDGGSALPAQLREFIVPCDPGDRPLVLLHLVLGCGKGRVLCFTNSLETTHRLHVLMEQMGKVSSAEVSGALSKGKRKKTLEQFRDGVIQVSGRVGRKRDGLEKCSSLVLHSC